VIDVLLSTADTFPRPPRGSANALALSAVLNKTVAQRHLGAGHSSRFLSIKLTELRRNYFVVDIDNSIV